VNKLGNLSVNRFKNGTETAGKNDMTGDIQMYNRPPTYTCST